MGGSGSGYFRSDPDTIKKKLQDSEAETENLEHEIRVVDLLSSMLAFFNKRDMEVIDTHLTEIKKALEKEIEGTVDLNFGGSIAKHTYVDGLSDIDSLVLLNNSEIANRSPDEVKKYFAQRLKERFPATEIRVGTLAVTLRFSDCEIQLLPAVRSGEHFKIADKTGNNWAQIKPRAFSEKLSRINKDVGQKVVPVIKLAKAIISNLPEKHRISGYHTESLAVSIFQQYKDEMKPKKMLKHFFNEASKLVKQSIRDSTGQSVHVDDYLGKQNSLERLIISDAFSRVYRRMRNADSAGSMDEWKNLF